MKNILTISLNHLYNTINDKYNFFIIIISSIALIFFISISQDFSLFKTALFNDSLSISNRLFLLSQLLPLFNTYSIFIYDLLIILISIFISLNLILIYQSYKYKQISKSGSYTSAFGIIIWVLGIGCISCGAAIITSLLSIVGFTSLLLILPYNGIEFLVFSIILIIISTILHGYILNKNSCSIQSAPPK